MQDLYPLLVLVIGMSTIIGMITILRMNAFVSLITAAILVSFLGPGALAEKVNRVATAFGNAAGNIGIVIALAVIIGRCMMESGAADRIVRAFLTFLGQKRVSIALMSSGFVLSIPVFFDTVFYLLVPLARSAYKRTQTHYIRYIIAIAAGGAVTHSLVPPTPGPLLMAQNLNLEIGTLILVGLAVGLPTAIAGLVYAHWIDTRVVLSNPPNDIISGKKDPLDDIPLPNLTVALLPIVLPVIMVSLNTIMGTLAKDALPTSALHRWAPLTAAIGNVNFAMLVAAAAAMITLVIHRKKNSRGTLSTRRTVVDERWDHHPHHRGWRRLRSHVESRWNRGGDQPFGLIRGQFCAVRNGPALPRCRDRDDHEDCSGVGNRGDDHCLRHDGGHLGSGSQSGNPSGLPRDCHREWFDDRHLDERQRVLDCRQDGRIHRSGNVPDLDVDDACLWSCGIPLHRCPCSGLADGLSRLDRFSLILSQQRMTPLL